MVTPRWLREHRRAQARAVREAVAAEIAEEVVTRTFPNREPTFTELMRAQGVKPFAAEEHRRRKSPLTSEDLAELRTALAEARRQ